MNVEVVRLDPAHRSRSSRRIRSSSSSRRASSSPRARSGCAIAACCCSAIRTRTASTSTTRAARARCGVPREVRLRRRRYRRVRPARLERHHARPRGPAHASTSTATTASSELEKNGRERVLADRYEGKRLNSPNDLVYRSDGTLFFTDPPFGLPKFFDDPRKELPYSGVYRDDGRQAEAADAGADRPERHRLLAGREVSSTSATGTRRRKS